jgi:hypothetical protein
MTPTMCPPHLNTADGLPVATASRQSQIGSALVEPRPELPREDTILLFEGQAQESIGRVSISLGS